MRALEKLVLDIFGEGGLKSRSPDYVPRYPEYYRCVSCKEFMDDEWLDSHVAAHLGHKIVSTNTAGVLEFTIFWVKKWLKKNS